jgi:hypothetical protein
MILGLRAAGIEMSLIPVSVRYPRACGLAYLPVENETKYRRFAAAWRHVDPSP